MSSNPGLITVSRWGRYELNFCGAVNERLACVTRIARRPRPRTTVLCLWLKHFWDRYQLNFCGLLYKRPACMTRSLKYISFELRQDYCVVFLREMVYPGARRFTLEWDSLPGARRLTWGWDCLPGSETAYPGARRLTREWGLRGSEMVYPGARRGLSRSEKVCLGARRYTVRRIEQCVIQLITLGSLIQLKLGINDRSNKSFRLGKIFF